MPSKNTWLVAFLLSMGAVAAGDGYAATDYTPSGWGAFAVEVLRSLDFISFALLTILLVFIGMFIDLFAHLRISKLLPESLLVDVQEEMTNGEYEKALELSQKSESMVGQVFAAALSKTDYSFERMQEAMRSEVGIQAMVWRQWIGQFRITAIVGFLLGCAGALLNAMRFVADLHGRPNLGLALASSFEMRGFLYNMLFALLVGCLMSVLALVAGSFASSKLEKVLLETERLGEELLDPFRPLPTTGEGLA